MLKKKDVKKRKKKRDGEREREREREIRPLEICSVYLEGEIGLKSNPRCFFRFANSKRNSSGYPSAMFLGDTCVWD
jgi:hypothetical protein